MKKLVRLTESDLHKIVKESVKKLLKENNTNEIINMTSSHFGEAYKYIQNAYSLISGRVSHIKFDTNDNIQNSMRLAFESIGDTLIVLSNLMLSIDEYKNKANNK